MKTNHKTEQNGSNHRVQIECLWLTFEPNSLNSSFVFKEATVLKVVNRMQTIIIDIEYFKVLWENSEIRNSG